MARHHPLSIVEKDKISNWSGLTHGEFNLLYRASRDGCSPAAFHLQCDQKGPTVTVAYGTTGHVFGGYTSLPWRQDGSWTADGNSYLFSLRNPNGQHMEKLPATGSSKVFLGAGNGPLFGNNGVDVALQMMDANYNGTKEANGIFTKPGLIVNLEIDLFARNTMTSEVLTGGTQDVYDIDVYELKESQLLSDEQTWRKLDLGLEWKPNILKEAVMKHKSPESLNVPHTRILLLGPCGSGKSSFFNTINSAFRGYVTSQALTGTGKHSITTKLRSYKVRPEECDPLNFRICDAMGFEEDGGLILHDVPYVLDGNVQDHFQFNPATGVTPNHAEFQSGPKLKDKIHVVVFVLDATSISALNATVVEKMQAAAKMAKDRVIPSVILLTNIDKFCSYVAEDITKVFHSRKVLELVSTVADMFGAARAHVLPVKNYELEISTEDGVDTLALLALRQMLRFAGDFFNEQLDILGE